MLQSAGAINISLSYAGFGANGSNSSSISSGGSGVESAPMLQTGGGEPKTDNPDIIAKQDNTKPAKLPPPVQKPDANVTSITMTFSPIMGCNFGLDIVNFNRGQDAGKTFLYPKIGANIGFDFGVSIVTYNLDFQEQFSSNSYTGYSNGYSAGFLFFTFGNMYSPKAIEGFNIFNPFSKLNISGLGGGFSGSGFKFGGSWNHTTTLGKFQF